MTSRDRAETTKGGLGGGRARADMEDWLRALGMTLGERAWGLLLDYLNGVESYNDKVNLTADGGEALLLRHAADALAALPPLRRALPGLEAPEILDVGAGAGFIGMTLKIAWPEADVTLNESSRRKFQFLNRAAARLGLKGLHVVYGSAPKALGRRMFHAVLARAVAPLEETIRVSMPLLRAGAGVLLAYQSAPPDFAAPPLKKAVEQTKAVVDGVAPYRLPREAADRRLVILRRAGDRATSRAEGGDGRAIDAP